MLSLDGLDSAILPPTASLVEAIQSLEVSSLQLILVCDPCNRLLGTVSDGDLRRYLLRTQSFSGDVRDVMNQNPIVVDPLESFDQVQKKMRLEKVGQIPVVTANSKLLGLWMWDERDDSQDSRDDTLIVIMAGGKGLRMRPLTESVPKPMLEINGEPMLQIIIEKFVREGFREFIFTTNYLSGVIKNYFGSGKKFGASITYVEEIEPLGTAGSLSLIPPDLLSKFENVIVTNADVITNLNFSRFQRHHLQCKNRVTLVVNKYSHNVPYGVVAFDDNEVVSIDEKPTFSWFVSSGICILDRQLISRLSKNERLDMPDFLQSLALEKINIGVYPIFDSWRDVGSPNDLIAMNRGVAND